MADTKFNYDYLKQAIEIPLLFVMAFKNKKMPRHPKRILIINTCLIGDIVASLPAMRQFIAKRKNAKIDIIVPSPSKSIVEKVRGVNKVYVAKSVSNRKIETINLSDEERREISDNNYDMILIMRLSKDAYNLLSNIENPILRTSFTIYIKYILHLAKHILYKGKVKQYSNFNFELMGERKKNKNFNEIFAFSKEDMQKIEKMQVMHGKKKKIIVHAGSGWRKHWENNKWAELLNKVNKLGNFKFIFIGGEKREERDYNLIQKKLNFKAYSLVRKINLGELFLIMRKSDYFLGIDSGPRNMAHLANLRSVSLLGPGPKHFMPLNKRDVIIDKSDCICTHMLCLRRKTCMQKITVNDVFEGFKKLSN